MLQPSGAEAAVLQILRSSAICVVVVVVVFFNVSPDPMIIPLHT